MNLAQNTETSARKELEGLANRATAGNWTAEAIEALLRAAIGTDAGSIDAVIVLQEGKQIKADAAFISAANPTAIKALLTKLTALEGELALAKSAAEQLCVERDAAESRASTAEAEVWVLREALTELLAHIDSRFSSETDRSIFDWRAREKARAAIRPTNTPASLGLGAPASVSVEGGGE